ncbi:phosphate ABC transporter permease PstA [Halapricum desulfuricans]|uniref:Phosphate transport system permease protein PstA n=1 Tax=Halapricum desulfuricans TaxID=2841257 RepID=A0A897NX89_9EURY|nr:phosphate ABC transporter permease PstA [Halapricum desulfuricans]QSG15229.1 ABC-type phosphate transport system, permease component [Halapricum desulfuricans]
MSDAYSRPLVRTGTSSYERAAVLTIALAFALFGGAVGTFFGWVPTTETVGGVSGLTFFGAASGALGAAIVGLGIASNRANVGTQPGASTGVTASTVLAVVWLLTARALLGTVIDAGALAWALAVGIGAGVWYATVTAREDLGSTLPVGGFLVVIGAIIISGLVGPGWQWESTAFAVTVSARTVVPLVTMGGGLLAIWTAGKAYGGFGATGRQHGAFLLLSLVVVLVIGVLAFLLLYVAERGIGTVVENLSVSAGTLAVVGTAALIEFAVQARRGFGASSAPRIVATYVRAGLAGLLAVGILGLGYAVLTGSPLSTATTTIEPTLTAGAVPAVLVAGWGLLVLRARSPSWNPVGDAQQTLRRITLTLVGLSLAAVGLQAVAGPLVVAGIAPVAWLALLVAGIGLLGVVGRSLSERSDGSGQAWLAPASYSGRLFLWGIIAAGLHALVTGRAVGTHTVGIVDRGTIVWPFVTNPTQGLGIQTGVYPALVGTIWIVLGAVVFAVPIAVGAAVFLTEYAEDSAFTGAVDIATNGLWSTPSIVFGLFGLAFVVPRFGNSGSILASQLVLGFMLLPLVLITSREAMQSVPDEYRDASAALGVSRWQTIRSVVIPASMPGIITGVILGVGRIAGETAPLLLVLNGPVAPTRAPSVLSSFRVGVSMQPPFVHVSNPALLESASALPYQLYAIITAGVLDDLAFGWGTAFVLLGVVLAFFAVAVASRRYFRKKLHHD